MEHVVERLLGARTSAGRPGRPGRFQRWFGHYERGRISRRRLIRAVATAATVSAGSAATGLRGVSLNHVTFRVTDIQRSSRFYRDLAGLRIREQKERGRSWRRPRVSWC